MKDSFAQIADLSQAISIDGTPVRQFSDVQHLLHKELQEAEQNTMRGVFTITFYKDGTFGWNATGVSVTEVLGTLERIKFRLLSR